MKLTYLKKTDNKVNLKYVFFFFTNTRRVNLHDGNVFRRTLGCRLSTLSEGGLVNCAMRNQLGMEMF